jgi:hypothetical protein
LAFGDVPPLAAIRNEGRQRNLREQASKRGSTPASACIVDAGRMVRGRASLFCSERCSVLNFEPQPRHAAVAHAEGYVALHRHKARP